MNYTMLRGDENMAKVEQCPGFETFGADVKTAREKLGISRRELAEKIGVDPRYLANIELNATIPSMPLVVQLFHVCRLPAEKYFNPELRKQEIHVLHQKVSHILTAGYPTRIDKIRNVILVGKLHGHFQN